VTVAFTAPKYTILLAGVELKFAPVIVTVVPIEPEVGEKDEMVGGGGAIVVRFHTADHALVPPAFVASTRQKYFVRYDKPLILFDVAVKLLES
jgi:hypothetical protein